MNQTPLRLTCPCCQQVFAAAITTSFRVAGHNSDLSPQYLGENPLLSLVHLCRRCGFAGFEVDYREYATPNLTHKLRNIVDGINHEPESYVPVHERFRRTALISAALGEATAKVADRYLQACWAADVDEDADHDAKRRLWRKTVFYFLRAIEEQAFDEHDLPYAQYLVGEFTRRLGDRNTSGSYFRVAGQSPHLTPDLKQHLEAQARLRDNDDLADDSADGPAT